MVPLFPSMVLLMKWYAEFYGEWNSRRGNYKWQKLVNTAKQQQINISDITAHRALADGYQSQGFVPKRPR